MDFSTQRNFSINALFSRSYRSLKCQRFLFVPQCTTEEKNQLEVALNFKRNFQQNYSYFKSPNNHDLKLNQVLKNANVNKDTAWPWGEKIFTMSWKKTPEFFIVPKGGHSFLCWQLNKMVSESSKPCLALAEFVGPFSTM